MGNKDTRGTGTGMGTTTTMTTMRGMGWDGATTMRGMGMGTTPPPQGCDEGHQGVQGGGWE